jgi:hypothetical protein
MIVSGIERSGRVRLPRRQRLSSAQMPAITPLISSAVVIGI